MGEEPRGLLLVEDDPRLGSIMQDVLALDWQVELATDLAQARTSLGDHLFAVAIVDRRLPDGDGADLVAWMRARADATPVLILTALGATADKVEGLDAGANDYLVKPFAFEELLARLRALQRAFTTEGQRREIGGWTLTPASQALYSPEGARISLTETETALLDTLASSPEHIFTREELLGTVFRTESDGPGAGASAVDTYVHYVRRKTSPEIIETVRGRGYRLGAPS